MSAQPWIAWAVSMPLAGALLCVLLHRRAQTIVAIVASLMTTFIAVALAAQVAHGGVIRHAVGGWPAPLGIGLRADGLAALFVAAFAVVGLGVSAYAAAYYPSGSRPVTSFFPLWLFTWAALDALVLSADVFNLYVTLELMTLAAVGLIAAGGHEAALKPALRYLLLAVPASLLYLVGVALLYMGHATLDIERLGAALQPGPLAWTAFAFMTVALLLKTALFPLHAWLPPAHASAPSPVSALLSALVVKGSFYILLRLWIGLFAAALRPGLAQLVGALGVGAIVWGSLLALRQRRLKMIVAYSTVAQIGYLFLLFPIGTPAARAGGVYLAISHAAAKAAMFMAAGTVQRAVGHDDLDAMEGVAHRLPITFFAMGIAGMTLIGMPPSGGFVAKWLLLRATIERGQWIWAVVLIAGGLFAAGYMFRVLRGAFLPTHIVVHRERVTRTSELVTLSMAFASLLLGIVPRSLLALGNVGAGP